MQHEDEMQKCGYEKSLIRLVHRGLELFVFTALYIYGIRAKFIPTILIKIKVYYIHAAREKLGIVVLSAASSLLFLGFFKLCRKFPVDFGNSRKFGERDIKGSRSELKFFLRRVKIEFYT